MDRGNGVGCLVNSIESFRKGCVCRLKKVVHSKVQIVRWAQVTETKHPENVTLQAGILYTAELLTKFATKCMQTTRDSPGFERETNNTQQ